MARRLKSFRRKKGFERASKLVADRVRSAGETRGFAVSRLLTHWDEIIGADLCGMARPIDISYGKGFGATLCNACKLVSSTKKAAAGLVTTK